MQYSQEHLKTMVYAEFGGQTDCIMGNWKIENWKCRLTDTLYKNAAKCPPRKKVSYELYKLSSRDIGIGCPTSDETAYQPWVKMKSLTGNERHA